MCLLNILNLYFKFWSIYLNFSFFLTEISTKRFKAMKLKKLSTVQNKITCFLFLILKGLIWKINKNNYIFNDVILCYLLCSCIQCSKKQKFWYINYGYALSLSITSYAFLFILFFKEDYYWYFYFKTYCSILIKKDFK